MGKIDILNSVDVDLSIAYAAKTSTATGTSSDLLGYGGAFVKIVAGAWTDGSHTFAVQESDNNSDWTAVADADLYGDAEPVIDGAADDDQSYRIGYKGEKRYLRVVSTVAGASTGAIYGAYIVKGPKMDGLIRENE